MNEKEIFIPVNGYEGLYEVSNFGRVKALKRVVVDKNGSERPFAERFLKTQKTKPTGNHQIRYTVELWKENKRKVIPIHRVVALSFIPNPENKPQVNHIDGDPSNNHVSNLEWSTNSENMLHAYKKGLAKPIGRKPIRGMNIKTGEVLLFESTEQAARYLNINPDAIRHTLKGRTKTGKGFKWEYQ